MPSTPAVNFTTGAHLTSETGANIGSSASPSIAALSIADGNTAVNSSVTGIALASKIPVYAIDAVQNADSLVKSTQVATFYKIDISSYGTVWASEVTIADASTKGTETIATTILYT